MTEYERKLYIRNLPNIFNMVKVGDKFFQTLTGLTVTGYGTYSKLWEVLEIEGDEVLCGLLHSDAAMVTNTDVRRRFSIKEVESYSHK